MRRCEQHGHVTAGLARQDGAKGADAVKVGCQWVRACQDGQGGAREMGMLVHLYDRMGEDVNERVDRQAALMRVHSSCGVWAWRNFVIQTCHVIMVGGIRRSYHIPQAYNLCLLYVSCCSLIVYPDNCASY